MNEGGREQDKGFQTSIFGGEKRSKFLLNFT